MDYEWKIDVGLTPHYHDNPKQPYYWCIFKYTNEWCNNGFGWANSSGEAFAQALSYYNKINERM